SGSLLIQTQSGGFTKSQAALFRKDMFFEDVDAGFFDADNDGDPDLLVVSGGNEYILPNPFMKDRLYLNQGDGNFIRADKNLPAIYHNGSCFAPGDIDGDGDLDIFLGSRSMPGAYGISPASYLLVNDGKGFFTDMTAELAPELSDIGMVTDAVWMDMDLDDDPDLVVTGEWMPVIILANEGGRLVKNPDTGTGQSGGWWFTLEVTDIDNDGDEDLVAGNLGLNSYLTATPEYPVRLYINDFDQDGRLDHIITSYKQGTEYPFAPADNLFDQIPALRSMYKDYADFAGTSIHELFPGGIPGNSIIREVHCFESSIFINDGKGSFERIPLPAEIQFSPVLDLLIADIDLDQQPEMLVGGNFYPVIPYFGMYDASYGWLVRILPGLQLEVLYPEKSGFQVKGEIRDMEIFRTGRDRKVIVGVNNQSPEVFKFTGK
ncbi:MAG: VCBS repeat-containing protein, partial [Cyclobacteriaceae bacterium]|nr:VCBS repeat-containing protein [Cyclobacteriaceae bacterium]